MNKQNKINHNVNKTKEELEEKSKLPTNDIIFHELFGQRGSEEIVRKFIEKVLKKKIRKIDLDLNPYLERNYYDDKLGILDVRARDDKGTNINIEMQNTTSKMLPQRILSYWSRLYTGDLKQGITYSSLNKTIAILIVNENMTNLKEIKKYHTKWHIREEEYTNIIFTDYFELHVIELQKYIETRTKENKDDLLDAMANQDGKGGVKGMEENIWLDFLVNPECEAVAKAMETDEELRIVYKRWKKIMADKALRDQALRLEYAEYDRNTQLEEATTEGLERRNERTELKSGMKKRS